MLPGWSARTPWRCCRGRRPSDRSARRAPGGRARSGCGRSPGPVWRPQPARARAAHELPSPVRSILNPRPERPFRQIHTAFVGGPIWMAGTLYSKNIPDSLFHPAEQNCHPGVTKRIRRWMLSPSSRYPGEALMDDHEFPLPVAVLTIVIARLVLFWQRLSDRLPPGSVAPATAQTPHTMDFCRGTPPRSPAHHHLRPRTPWCRHEGSNGTTSPTTPTTSERPSSCGRSVRQVRQCRSRGQPRAEVLTTQRRPGGLSRGFDGQEFLFRPAGAAVAELDLHLARTGQRRGSAARSPGTPRSGRRARGRHGLPRRTQRLQHELLWGEATAGSRWRR